MIAGYRKFVRLWWNPGQIRAEANYPDKIMVTVKHVTESGGGNRR